ncbi:hypothetical protein IT575_12970 [bacterium]|nr:hypothetical protein [bacterium]
MDRKSTSSTGSTGRTRQPLSLLALALSALLCAAATSCGGARDTALSGLDSAAPHPAVSAAPGSVAAAAGPLLPHSGSVVDIPDEFLPPGDGYDELNGQDGQIDPDVIWASIHQALSPGNNELDTRRYTGKNDLSQKGELFIGYEDDGMGGQTPAYGPGMWLLSEPGELGFVTYGLRSLPEGHRIESLSISCGGLYVFDENPDDFWVGVSDRQADAWRWYGPFELGDLSDLDISAVELMNADEEYGYITIATHDTDALGIVGLSLEVNPVI